MLGARLCLMVTLTLLVACDGGTEAPPLSGCIDDIRDNDETDVDCGGSCRPCQNGRSCMTETDCASRFCNDGVCGAPPSCSDGERNGDESDIDCGGSCDPCPSDGGCESDDDCRSGICRDGACEDAPGCDDGERNGDESDTDCGGACDPCDDGAGCATPEDCESGHCDGGICAAAPACDDGIHNGDESDTDCGGSCRACPSGGRCDSDGDCRSGICRDEVCAGAQGCDDGEHNGDETDIDCGGSCDPCADSSGCRDGSDCLSGLCHEGTCAPAPTCDDGVHNGDETDVDCGGPDCDPCADGAGCRDGSDCLGRLCHEGTCAAAPTCDDGERNGDETDTDCGGSCDPCAPGSACSADEDCEVSLCVEGSCAVPDVEARAEVSPARLARGDDFTTVIELDGSASTGVGLTAQWIVTGARFVDDTDETSEIARATFAGDQDVDWTLIVRDALGTTDHVSGTVALNRAPLARIVPVGAATVGEALTLDGSESEDLDGDDLDYAWTVTERPEGSAARLSASDRASIELTPDLPGVYRLGLVVDDGLDESTPALTALVAVAEDRVPPEVEILFTPRSPVDPGTPVTVEVVADDASDVELAAWLNGEELELDGDGLGEFVPAEPGLYEVEVVAIDAASHERRASASLTARADSNNGRPTARITSPGELDEITAPVEVIGTANDLDLAVYRLEIRRGDGPWQEVAEGWEPVVDGVLGELDPTLLERGIHELRLTAMDTYGNVSRARVPVEISGTMVLGAVRMSFVDLVVPLSGIPIVIQRIYDSRRREAGDFGFNWDLETGFGSVEITHTNPPADGWSINGSPCVPCGFFCRPPSARGLMSHITEVRIGDRGYRFRFDPILPENYCVSGFQGAEPRWTALEGTDATLTALNGHDGRGEIWLYMHGGYFCDRNGTWEPERYTYNPTQFLLETADGESFQINTSGIIEAIEDAHGNQLVATEDGIRHTGSGATVRFTRDGQGRITTITTPDGDELAYAYGPTGDLDTFTDRAGGVTRFLYDDDHLLTSIIDPRGEVPIRNEYDASGRLIGTVDAHGGAYELDYDVEERISVITDRLGNARTVEYDERGNVIRETDPDGGVTTHTYDDRGNLTSTTNPLSQRETFEYDGHDQLLRRIDPLGHAWSFTFDERGNRLTERDPEGNIRRWGYDARSNLTSYDDGAGSRMTLSYDGEGDLTGFVDDGDEHSFTYDRYGRMASWTDVMGQRSEMTTNDQGLMTREEYVVETPDGSERVRFEYDYDDAGNLTKIIGPDGATANAEYNEEGEILAMVDPEGRVSEVLRDPLGRITAAVAPDGAMRRFEYDAEDRLVAVVAPGGARHQMVRDWRGRVTKRTTPGGNEIRYEYDAAGRLTKRVDPLGGATRYHRDATGRLIKRTDPLGGQTRYERNGNGHVIAQTDPLGHRVELERDIDGRVTSVTREDGGVIELTYDGDGELSSMRDPLGNDTTWTTSAGMLSGVIDAMGGETQYEITGEGMVGAIVDAAGRRREMEYSHTGALLSRTLPLGMSERLSYDASGRLVSVRDAADGLTSLEYDEAGRLIESAAPDGARITFEYDAAGRIRASSNENGSWFFGYDAEGRLTRVTEPDGRFVEYEYDALGRRTSMRTPSGITRYESDALGRLIRLVDPDGLETTYSYDDASRLIGVVNPNGVRAAISYDEDGRVIDITHADADDEVIWSESYTRDLAGRVVMVERSDGSSVEYAYDRIGQLTAEVVTSADADVRRFSYEYDAVGNRLRRTGPEGDRRSRVDDNDRLLDDGASEYTYDVRGNVIRREGGGETLELRYNGWGQLVEVTREGGEGPRSIRYLYDPAGARVARIVDGEVERYLLDRATPFTRVLEESNDSGDVLARNVFGAHIASRISGDDLSVFHLDQLGSVRMVTDGAGEVSARYDYDAFGLTNGLAPEAANPYGFAGERFDAALGAYDMRARHYWPGIGRFLQMDRASPSLRDPRTLHRYTYAANDPVNLVDPSGHCFFSIAMITATAAIFPSVFSMSSNAIVSMSTWSSLAGFLGAGGTGILQFEGDHDGERLFSHDYSWAFFGVGVERWRFGDAVASYSVAEIAYEPWGRDTFISASVSVPGSAQNKALVWEANPDIFGGTAFAYTFSMGRGVASLVNFANPAVLNMLQVKSVIQIFFNSAPALVGLDMLQSHGAAVGMGIRLETNGSSFSVPSLKFSFLYSELTHCDPEGGCS